MVQRWFTIMGACLALSLAVSSAGAGSAVRLRTALGDIDLELYDSLAPLTAENFLNYVGDGDYDDSFIHRSVPGFVIQGGGFTMVGQTLGEVPTDPPIVNEFNPATMSNTRGTIAMARSTALDSAAGQWFINLVDNLFLDNPASPYCVFGDVVSGMDVVDAIAGLVVHDKTDLHPVFGTLPMIDYQADDPVLAENLVILTAAWGETPGDASFDGVVDGLDYNIWSVNYLGDGYWGDADYNGDRSVDNLDFALWEGNYGFGRQGSPLPEPAALMLFGVAVPFLLSRRRRRD